ncbi:transcriptional regulator BetI [Nocardia otitidiscaviarum]|uniref:Transcriptional regulator BetI n=1 Tax=Nocardia otitidiscaviarum TaxID=1823 RepID=A0A378YTQ9_9NOCA|nr:TetR/AcrR family transcriptional regulator [Nocardia otitidiscaviarum]SUA79861.1 transcriptional regulator BetI [Nocardia otitidiscaviarum]
MPTDRLDEVLDATYECLGRYGVKRTTVDDIARTMGVSRSAVYQYVRGKDDAVRQLAQRLHARALTRAQVAAESDAAAAQRIRGVLAAKLDLVLRLIEDSPHATELIDEKARLFGDICVDYTAELRALLVRLFAEAGTASSVSPEAAADLSIALVVGLEQMPQQARRLFDTGVTALLAGLLAT